MSVFENIINEFSIHLELASSNIETLMPHMAEATHLFTEALLAEKKIFCCASANCFSAGNQFCHILANGYALQRPGLPVLFLGLHTSSILAHNHCSSDEVYARQIQALAKKDDILFIISDSDNEPGLAKAIQAAEEMDMPVVALLFDPKGVFSSTIKPSGVIMAVQSDNVQLCQSLHYLVSLILATLIEQQLFGTSE